MNGRRLWTRLLEYVDKQEEPGGFTEPRNAVYQAFFAILLVESGTSATRNYHPRKCTVARLQGMLGGEKMQPLLLVQNVKVTCRTGGSRPNMNPRKTIAFIHFDVLAPVLREVDRLVFTYAALFRFDDRHPLRDAQRIRYTDGSCYGVIVGAIVASVVKRGTESRWIAKGYPDNAGMRASVVLRVLMDQHCSHTGL